jgi:hypothetical protein
LVGWHPYVDDREIGSMLTNEAEELCRVAGLPDDGVAGLREHAGDPFAEQDVVVGHDDPPFACLQRLPLHAWRMRDLGEAPDVRSN